MSDQVSSTVVFYDGGCPLCSREIAHYRRLERRGAVEWVDLHQAGDRIRKAGITPAAAMARLHVIDPRSGVLSGVPAFIALWRQLPYYRHLASVVEGLKLTTALDRLYDRFARWRLRRRCRSGSCGPAGRSANGRL